MFGAIKLTKNADINKCGYSGYRSGLDAHSQRSLLVGEWGKNIVISGVNNNLLRHYDNRGKDILVLGQTNGLHGTGIKVEAKYYINITSSKNKFI